MKGWAGWNRFCVLFQFFLVFCFFCTPSGDEVDLVIGLDSFEVVVGLVYPLVG